VFYSRRLADFIATINIVIIMPYTLSTYGMTPTHGNLNNISIYPAYGIPWNTHSMREAQGTMEMPTTINITYKMVKQTDNIVQSDYQSSTCWK
jgi:hypothetical protein